MEVRPHRIITRKKTREIKVGKVSVGGNSVISIQSMTNTLTTDIKNTIKQISKVVNKNFCLNDICFYQLNLYFVYLKEN